MSFIHTDSRSAQSAKPAQDPIRCFRALALRGHSSLKVHQESGEEGQVFVFQEGRVITVEACPPGAKSCY